jgi:hypothetical protein
VVPAPPPGWADASPEELAVLARVVARVSAADPLPGLPRTAERVPGSIVDSIPVTH